MTSRRRTCAALLLALGGAAAVAEAPSGWLVAGSKPADYEYATDASQLENGKRSALIEARPGAAAGGFGTLMQTIAADDYRGGRWRLSGYLRTADATRAQMWMRVDGPDRRVLAFDNMDDRPVTGTTAWARYEVVLDVPPDSQRIAFGFFLMQGGKVWGNSFALERVDASVHPTGRQPGLARRPQNLDFEQ